MPRRYRPRVNWALRWGGLAVCASVAAIYLVSSFRAFWGYVQSDSAQVEAALWRGQVKIGFSRRHRGDFVSTRDLVVLGPPSGKQVDWLSTLGSRFNHYQSPSGATYLVFVPLWPAVVLAGPLCALAWGRRGRVAATTSACLSCNYDLSGLPPGSPCPECATSPKR